MITLDNRLRPTANTCHPAWVWLIGLLSLLASPPALAQLVHDFRLLPDPQRTVSTQRAYFVYESVAGRVIDDAIVVRNESDQSQRLTLFAADTITASRGGIAVASHSVDAAERAGAWLHLSQTALNLEPREHRSVPFTLRVPDDLPPGEYAASIVAQRAEEGDGGESGPMGVRFIPRFAVTVLVTVPGTADDPLEPDLEITDLRAATGARQQTIIGDLSNSGNDGLDQAQGHLTIRQTDGVLAREAPVRLGYFLAGDDLGYRIGVQPELAAGEYDVTLSFTHDQGTAELTRRLYLGKVPEIPVLRADDPPADATQPTGLPRWVLVAIGVAGLSILLLLALLTLQARRLARARLRT